MSAPSITARDWQHAMLTQSSGESGTGLEMSGATLSLAWPWATECE